MGITNWKGIAPHNALNRNLDDFFNDSFRRLVDWEFRNEDEVNVPPVNVTNGKIQYEIQVVAPGMDKEDFDLNIENNVLTVTARKEEKTNEKKNNYTTQEYYFHSLRRSFTLPEEVDQDKISAHYHHGVLEIQLPKKPEVEAPTERKSISVS